MPAVAKARDALAMVRVNRLADVAREREWRNRHPSRARLELLRRSGGCQPGDRGNGRRAPGLARLDDCAGDVAARDQGVIADCARAQRRRQTPAKPVIPFRDEQAQHPVAPILAPAVHAGHGGCRGGGGRAMPTRARHLKRRADPSARRHVVCLDPDVAHPKRRRGVAERTGADAGPISEHRHAKSGPGARAVARAVIRDVLLSGDDADLRARRRRSILRRNEEHLDRRRQHDDVHALDGSERNPGRIQIDRVTAERQQWHAVPVDLERCGPATAVQDDLRLPKPAAARDVDPGDVDEQVAQRARAGEENRVGSERVASASG